MTLMPVSNIWVFGLELVEGGRLAVDAQRSVTWGVSPPSRSRKSPVALKTLPRVTSPTGT